MKHLLLLSCLALAMHDPVPATPASDEAARGNTRFACHLYAQLKDQKGNLFFSPYSISTALAMTSAGARGQTLDQMAAVLHLPKKDPHGAMGALQNELSQPNPGYQLVIANRLWPHSGFALLPAFEKLVSTHYRSRLVGIDYGDAEAARKTINDWVAQTTQMKIKNLIPSGILNPNTRLVLTNAIYFQGNWASRFQERATQRAPFTSADGSTTQCQLMNQSGTFSYAALDDIQILEMPYAGGRLAMTVLLPANAKALAALESKLDAAHWDPWIRSLQPQKVKVSLPRFQVEAPLALNPILERMGMVCAFDPDRSDLSGIMNVKPLFISAVLHKAFIDVNEKGTEAAAATAVVVATRSAPREPESIVFRADRAFVYVIRDTKTGSVLFLGRLDKPPSS